MGIGLTADEIKQFYRNAQNQNTQVQNNVATTPVAPTNAFVNPNLSEEERQKARDFITTVYNQSANTPQNAFVNPNLTEEERQKARDFITTVYNNSNASDGTRPSEIPPTNNITNTIPTLVKPSDAITDKDYSKVKESQNAREKAIADAVRANRVEESQKAREKAIQKAYKDEKKRHEVSAEEESVPTSIYNTDILGNDLKTGTLSLATPTPQVQLEEGNNYISERKKEEDAKEKAFKEKLGISDNKAERTKRASKMVAENSVNVNNDNAVETASRLMNPDYIKSTNKDYYDYELKQAKNAAKDFENRYGINLNSVSDINIKKIQDLVRSGEISQDEVDAYRSILYRNTLTEDLANGVASFGGTFAKPATAIGGIFDPNMRDTNLSLNQRLEDVSNTSPLASGVGNFAGMMANYQMANGVLDNVIPFDNALANLGKGQLADTVVSEIPQLITNAQSGKYNDENGNLDVNALAKDYRNMAVADFAFNAVPELLMNGFPKAVNEPQVNVPRSTDEIIDNAIKQSDEAVAEIERLAKDLNDLEDGGRLTPDEIRALMKGVVPDEEIEDVVAKSFADELQGSAKEEISNLVDEQAKITNDNVNNPIVEPEITNQNVNNAIKNEPIQQSDDFLNSEVPPISDAKLQREVDRLGEVRPKNEHGMELSYVPESNDVKKSKVVINTLVNRRLAQMADEVDRRIANYNVEHTESTVKEALKRVSTDSEKWTNDYLVGNKAIQESSDVDTVMMLLEDKRYQSAIARANGFTEEADRLANEAYLLKYRLRQAGTKGGQFVNAFKKWNGTADGALRNAELLMDSRGTQWAKRNKIADDNVLSTCKRLDKILNKMGDDSFKNRPFIPKSDESILKEIENTLKKEFAGIEGKFDEEDYKVIRSILKENLSDWQIEDEIRHKLRYGDWYTIDESIEIPKQTNSTIGSALRQIVDDGSTKLDNPEYTLNEIKQQVRNTLDEEMGGLSKQFGDADVDFLANMVNNGASSEEIANMMRTKLATGSFEISNDVVEQVNNLFDEASHMTLNSKERVIKETEAFRLLANASGTNSTIAEKFNAWRYLAMLGNPKTHVRNIVGNTIFSGINAFSNSVDASLQSGLDSALRKKYGIGIEKTKAILTPSDSNLTKACWNDAVDNNYRALTGDKYGDRIKNAIANERDVFKGKLLNDAVRGNSNLLGGEDFVAKRIKYQSSMAGYLKAHGLDEKVFDNEITFKNVKKSIKDKELLGETISKQEWDTYNSLKAEMQTLEDARAFAVKQAEYSTFNNENEVAKRLGEFSTKLRESDNVVARGIGRIVEGIVPFKNTPANVLKVGVEYSPLGIVRDVRNGIRAGNSIKKLKNGVDVDTKAITDWLEGVSKTLTGTGITALGYLLAKDGRLHSATEDTKWQDSLEGIQNYSIVLGNHSYTIDFAAPSVMPLLLGAELNKVIGQYSNSDDEENTGRTLDLVVDLISSGANLISPIVETSMLSGLSDTLDSIAQSRTEDALGSFASTATLGYFSQAIPTISGQFARTIDNTRRSTYSDYETPVARQIDKQVMKTMNKIPGLSFLNEPYQDVYGRTQNNGIVNTDNNFVNALPNLAYQMISPGYLQEINTTPEDAELRRLYKETGDAGVFFDLDTAPKLDGARLTKEQNTVYTKAKGEEILPSLKELFASPEYQSADDGQKAEMVKKIEPIVKKVGEQALDPENHNLLDEGKDTRLFARGGNSMEKVIPSLYESATSEKADDNKFYNESIAKAVGNTKETESLNRAEQLAKDAHIKLSKDAYDIFKSDGEDAMKDYLEYQNVMKDNGLDESKIAYKAYTDGNIDKYINEYLPKIKEEGLENSESLYNSFKNSKTSFENEIKSRKELKDAGLSNTEANKKAVEHFGSAEAVAETKNSLADFGLKKMSSSYTWDNVKRSNPNISMDEFAKTYKSIDTNSNEGITQDELIEYFNSHNISEKDANKMWTSYGSTKWKQIPVLNKDTGEFSKKKK